MKAGIHKQLSALGTLSELIDSMEQFWDRQEVIWIVSLLHRTLAMAHAVISRYYIPFLGSLD